MMCSRQEMLALTSSDCHSVPLMAYTILQSSFTCMALPCILLVQAVSLCHGPSSFELRVKASLRELLVQEHLNLGPERLMASAFGR